MYACMHPFMSEKYKIREFLKSSFGILIKWLLDRWNLTIILLRESVVRSLTWIGYIFLFFYLKPYGTERKMRRRWLRIKFQDMMTCCLFMARIIAVCYRIPDKLSLRLQSPPASSTLIIDYFNSYASATKLLRLTNWYGVCPHCHCTTS